MSEAMAFGANDLTEAERQLLDAAARGEPADLKRKAIRGQMLRDLMLEAHPGWRLPPGGIRLHYAIIQGGLDLEGCVLAKPLLIWHSRIEGGGDRGTLVIRDARLKRLGIHSCTVEGAIVADRVQIESGLFIGGGLIKGPVQVRGADIAGALALEGTEFGNGKQALLANGLSLSGPLYLRNARARGEVAFKRARLGGLYAEKALIEHAGIACDGESSQIKGDLLLDDARLTGSLLLTNAEIGGRLAADRFAVAAPPQPLAPDALQANGVNIGQSLSLAGARLAGALRLEGARIGKAFRAEGIEVEGGEASIVADVATMGGNWDLARAKLVGAMSCPGADVRGQLRLTEARIFGADIALRADGATIRGGCFMSRAIIIGMLRFPAATIGNQFRLRGASLKVEQGAALLASGSSFARDVELNGGLQTVGAIVLDQARIRGVLDLKSSGLKSAAIARSGAPLPDNAGARAGHQSLSDEVVLSLVDAEIDRIAMPETADRRPRGIVDLSRAHVGAYEDYAAAWAPPLAGRAKSRDGRDIDHIILDGFAYDHLTNPSGAPSAVGFAAREHSRHDDRVGANRIAWLEGQAACDLSDHFKPQAWVQLASRLAAQGYHEDARTVAIGRRRRERQSHSATAAQRWQDRFLDVFALYGYNPWRTIVWMATFVLLFAGIWGWAASHCTKPGCFDESVLVVTNRDAFTPGGFEQRYPAFNALAYSLDVFVPFVPLGYEDHWRPNIDWGPIAELPLPDVALLTGSPPADPKRPRKPPTLSITAGGLLYVMGLIETVLGLILTSLAVTGFTGILRSDQ